MGAVRERTHRLCRILTEGLLMQPGGPLLFGGCYLAGTGRDSGAQAFSQGFFLRLLEEQDFVSWTSEAFEENESYLRKTSVGYTIIILVALAALVGGGTLAYFRFFR
jgi:hypothetical protein